MRQLKSGDYIFVTTDRRTLYQITRPLDAWFDVKKDCEWIIVTSLDKPDALYEIQLVERFNSAIQLREEWGFVSAEPVCRDIMLLTTGKER